MKTRLNLVIDILLFLTMMLISGIGFLNKYTLPPGKERWEIFERNVDLFWLGLDRHEWGTIHLYLGIFFLILLIFHIIFHWTMIKSMFRLLIKNSILRKVFIAIICLTSIIFLLFSFFIEPQIIEHKGQGGAHGKSGCFGCPDKNTSCSGKMKNPDRQNLLNKDLQQPKGCPFSQK